MLVLVTYDVSTESVGGTKRLRKVAKTCQNYGQRVQNSVFECIVDSTQFETLKIELEQIIDKEFDSLRYYRLGNNYQAKVEHIGAKETLKIEDPLIF
ncbi:CRISPR-associated endonuclease Cas2 [Marinilactibacillus psychrotolerans]|uniref:CRISPR-associated endonuclease Cas2 n=1 Tax=Marinilactibacillus psychrotolerans TaxID=191770 RepID=UPI00388B4E07